MFAQRVAQPIMRIAQLWTDFQQTGISMARLGDILNTRTEVPPAHRRAAAAAQGPHPVRRGHLPLPARGAAGAAGAEPRRARRRGARHRRPQRLGQEHADQAGAAPYVPEQGRVLVDGIDISLIDAAQLRRQIGVVLQENLLFNRSVRENIAITDPAAPIEAVMRVAQLAGAHEFISELPEGYDTIVGEQGASLSGGQRQRIAIARALFTNPRILIFDEATSALDYESEAILQRNMAAICQGRTVIVIAHRLSSVRQAHRIVVIDKGRLVEEGSHDDAAAAAAGACMRTCGRCRPARRPRSLPTSDEPRTVTMTRQRRRRRAPPGDRAAGRYRDVFAAAWAVRHELAGPSG